MYFKKLSLIASIAILMLVFTGCINTQDNKTETPEQSSNEEETNENKVTSWKTYHNERFNFSIDYPKTWTIKHSQNNDGITFLDENKDQDIRVYGLHYMEDISNPYRNAENPNLTKEEVILESGIKAMLISGETDGIYHYEVVAIEDNIEYHFVSRTTKDFYQKNQSDIHEMVATFNIAKDITKRITSELIEAKLIEIENQFFDILFKPQLIDDSYEISNYHDKATLIEAVSQIADIQLVREYVDYYYTEEDGRLYIVPTESPVKVISEHSYDFIQVDENTCEISQNEESEMVGAYRVTVEFTFLDNRWKMTNRRIEIKE